MTVTFFGHRDLVYDVVIEQLLKKELEYLINCNADSFFLGGYGNFDMLCLKVLMSLKQKYSHIKLILVIPYLNRPYKTDMYDDTVYPPIENVPLRFAIVKRNEWMVDNSDIVVSYVVNNAGGAAKAVLYARRKKKQIINLAIYDY